MPGTRGATLYLASDRKTALHALCRELVQHPNVGIFVASNATFLIYSDGLQSAGNDVLAALREAHARPLLPLGCGSGDGYRCGRDLKRLGAEPPVDPEPGAEGRPIVPFPPDVVLKACQRVRTFQGGAYGGDERVHAAFGCQRTHGAQDLRAQTAPLVAPRYDGGEGRERVRGAPVVVGAQRALQELAHRGRQALRGAVPDKGDGVSDRDYLLGRLEEEDLVLREVVEEPVPMFRVAVQQKVGQPSSASRPACSASLGLCSRVVILRDTYIDAQRNAATPRVL